MKILVDARLYGLENTGIGRYVMELIKGISEYDTENQYTILLRKKYFNELNLPENFKKIEADFGVYGVVEQIKLLKILYAEKPDISHFPHFNTPFLWRGKFIVTIHDMVMHSTGRDASNLYFPGYLFKRLAYMLLFRHSVKNSQRIIVPTKFVKEQISQFYKIRLDKVIAINEGIDDIFRKKDSRPEVLEKYKLNNKDYIIYAGNVFPHKNIRKVIEAISILRDKEIAVKMIIVTKNNKFQEKLRRLVDEKKLKVHVNFTDYVTDEELGTLYRNSSAFIYPSLMEGFGLQGLEALAAGTKLIASDIPVFREVYGDCAFYFDPMNHFSIANAIEKALTDEQKKGVKELLDKYSWAKMVKETLKVYNSVSL